jgi:hypothetical protein
MVEDSQQSQLRLAVRTQPKASLASLLPHPPLPPLAAALRPQDDSVAVVPASTPQQTTLLTQVGVSSRLFLLLREPTLIPFIAAVHAK